MVDIFQYRTWAISETIFRDVAPRIMQALRGGHSIDAIFPKHTIEQILPRIQALLMHPDDGGATAGSITIDGASKLPVVSINNKNIAIIPVIGALTKYTGFCGEAGMQDYQNMIGRANASPTVDGIVLLMDSPGGTVDGTPEFGMTVRDSKKPVGVFGDRMVASAALWVASQADVIVGNKNNPTEFGSIGTLMITENWQKMMEVGNEPQIEIIRAPQSTDKALLNPVESIAESTRQEINAELKDITDLFIGAVKSGRGELLNTKLDGLFAGKMFDVNTAKQNGLIDSVGTLQTAVNKVAELARQQQSNKGTNENKNNSSANTMKFPKLSSLFGKAGKESKEVAMKVSASEGVQSEDTASLEAAEQRVADMEADISRLQAESTAKDLKIAELSQSTAAQAAQITSLTAEKASLTAEKADLQAKLEEKPKGEKTTVIEKDDESKNPAKEYNTSVDTEAAQIREQNSKLKTFK